MAKPKKNEIEKCVRCSAPAHVDAVTKTPADEGTKIFKRYSCAACGALWNTSQTVK